MIIQELLDAVCTCVDTSVDAADTNVRATSRYMSHKAATSAPLAVAVRGSAAIRISESSTGNLLSPRIFSKRSRNPFGIAEPPLSTNGMGLDSFGMLLAPVKALRSAVTNVWITSS